MSRTLARWLFMTQAPSAVAFVRLFVGWVFLSEGTQKFLFPADLGAGRFAQIGIPAPEVMGPFVGTVEFVSGALILVGLCTRLAAAMLVVDIAVAITSTKIPILIGKGFWGFAAPGMKHGFWPTAHESRTDVSMLFGAFFLLIVGAGKASLDAWLIRHVAFASGDARAE